MPLNRLSKIENIVRSLLINLVFGGDFNTDS